MAVLVAGTADAVHTARLMLGERFDYRCAFSLEQARASLRPAPELIARIIHRARWQAAIREPMVFVGVVVAAIGEAAALLSGPPGGDG